MAPVEITRTVIESDGSTNVYVDFQQPKHTNKAKSLCQVDSLKSLSKQTDSTSSTRSLTITGLVHHHNEDKIVLKRLGVKRNITVTLQRKDSTSSLLLNP